VQFIQHFHMGWDKPFILPTALAGQFFDTDQPSAVVKCFDPATSGRFGV
jgi:hypothetical protein